jgi:hypothetical protein
MFSIRRRSIQYCTRQHGSNTQHDMSQNKWEGEQQKDLEAQRVTLLCQS